MTLPEGINPAKIPPRERLDSLTEAELFAIIDYGQDQNSVWLGAQFWIDELSRRRTHGVLDRIAASAAAEADRAQEMVRLAATAAEENAKTAVSQPGDAGHDQGDDVAGGRQRGRLCRGARAVSGRAG